jgi:hypothetical protein
VVKSKGVHVERFNLAQDIAAFTANFEVKLAINSHGTKSLPMIFINGEVKTSGGYPSRSDLAQFVGVKYEPSQESRIQGPDIHEVEQKYANRIFLIPWKATEARDGLKAEVATTGAIHE